MAPSYRGRGRRGRARDVYSAFAGLRRGRGSSASDRHRCWPITPMREGDMAPTTRSARSSASRRARRSGSWTPSASGFYQLDDQQKARRLRRGKRCGSGADQGDSIAWSTSIAAADSTRAPAASSAGCHQRQDPVHVGDRLAVRRHAAVRLDRALARVVGGQDELGLVAEAVHQLAQVRTPPRTLDGRVEGLAHREPLRGRRHQLHQAARALARDGARLVVRLGADQGGDERGVDVVASSPPRR